MEATGLARRGLRFAGVVVSIVAVWAVLPSGALAEECSINKVSNADPGTALFDSGGYEWDIEDATGATEFDLRTFATFNDGGSSGPAGTPPGPRDTSDSYDQWGPLYVGATGPDAPVSTAYHSQDDNSCTREDGGRELVFPKLTLGGLQVQRKLFVAAGGLPGARILNLVTNPGAAPVTTSVQIGGINTNDGDLGSDNATAVRSSSSGDALLTTADLWAVTSDHAALAPNTNADLALAHVIDGAGGRDRIDFVQIAPPPDGDDLVWRWDGVTILPGQTAAFMSFEVQQGVASADAATEDAAAAAQAQAYQNAAPKPAAVTNVLFSGMTNREAGSVRNWPVELRCFGQAPTIVGDEPNDTLVGTSGADVIMSFAGNDTIKGKAGKDRICAAEGNDKLKGGKGKDKLEGGTGKDNLAGGGGKDTCKGGKGKDKASGCEKERKIP